MDSKRSGAPGFITAREKLQIDYEAWRIVQEAKAKLRARINRKRALAIQRLRITEEFARTWTPAKEAEYQRWLHDPRWRNTLPW